MKLTQAFHRLLNQWFPQVYSTQLLVILLALGAVGYYLWRNSETLPPRRFVALSIVAGLLGILVIGAGFRTPTIASILGLPAGSMVEKSLSWIKATIALVAAGLSVYEGTLIAQKKAPKRHW